MNRGLTLSFAVLCLLFAAESAHAHDLDSPDAGGVEQHLRDHESLERYLQDARDEWEGMTPAEQRQQLREEAAEQRSMEIAAGPPSVDGEWSTAPFPISTFAIHMTLMPNGKVLYWGYPPVGPTRPNMGTAGIMDPSGGGVPTDGPLQPPPIDIDDDGDIEPAPLYCSGQTLLPNGEVLITGGNEAFPGQQGYTTFAGMKEVWTFDPWNESDPWTKQPDMRHGRWYPTQTELYDGRTAILGGLDETKPETQINSEVEIFTPPAERGGIGRMSYVEDGDRQSDLYPVQFSLKDGGLFTGAPASPGLFDPDEETWSPLPGEIDFRTGSSGVLLPSGPSGPTDVMIMGGTSAQADPSGIKPAYASSEILDTEDPDRWEAGPEYNLSRSMANVVQLPDGSMVAVGGGAGFNDGAPPNEDEDPGYYYTDGAGERRQIEIFEPGPAPGTGTWRLGPPQREDRAYHSTAILLPDGRVLSAGDDFHPSDDGGFSQTDTAEIYSPPYLFQPGARPTVESAPGEVGYDTQFKVGVTGGAQRAVLMAPGAATHGLDMQQRHVELEVLSAGGGQMSLRAPSGGGVAPPGYYMLFVLNANDVPSVARWVRVDEPASDPPPSVPKEAPRGAGPGVSVKLLHPTEGAFVRALVRSDEAATVKVRVKVTARGRKAGARGATLHFSRAGKRTMGLRPKNLPGRLRATVTVNAHDSEGNATGWTRKLRVAPFRR